MLANTKLRCHRHLQWGCVKDDRRSTSVRSCSESAVLIREVRETGLGARLKPARRAQASQEAKLDSKQRIAKTPETMPLSVQSLGVTIVCDGNELQTYDVKQEGPNSIMAFVASEAGKVSSVPKNPLCEHEEYQLSRSAIQLHAQ
jgi:hypothetical protein